MKLLLLSDTHGHLDVINDLVEQTGADAVIHAGDFAFYDDQSVTGLGKRELHLRIIHSSLRDEAKRQAKGLSLEQMIAFVRDHCPLSQLPQYLSGEKAFSVPLYAVWGNHEDHAVVERFHAGSQQVQNLHLLHERQTFHIGRFHVFGLGGNVVVGPKLFQRPIAGSRGKVWSTMAQFAELCETVERDARSGQVRLFVSHVSPGKEPLVSLIGARARADFLVSGHMGAPFCYAWNEFTVREVGEAVERLRRRTEEILSLLCEGLPNDVRRGDGVPGEDELSAWLRLAEERISLGRRKAVPRWFAKMHYVNLPDAEVGYALLTERGGAISLDTHAEGYAR